MALSAEELIAKKELIEAEIRAQHDFLEKQDGVGMTGRLVDSEGFPRSDIDVYGVRTARNKIICLRNDHKALMKDIEAALHEIHAEARQRRTSEEEGGGPTAKEAESAKGFAKINVVTEGSPADIAGLKVNDILIEFGSLSAKNFHTLHDVASIVQHSLERPLRVVVRRRGALVVLSLLPRRWAGKGLLGCNIVPL